MSKCNPTTGRPATNYYRGGGGGYRMRSDKFAAEKTIRTERDKSVVNSIKLLMFARSVYYTC